MYFGLAKEKEPEVGIDSSEMSEEDDEGKDHEGDPGKEWMSVEVDDGVDILVE